MVCVNFVLTGRHRVLETSRRRASSTIGQEHAVPRRVQSHGKVALHFANRDPRGCRPFGHEIRGTGIHFPRRAEATRSRTDRGPLRNGVSFKVKGERRRNSSASRDCPSRAVIGRRAFSPAHTSHFAANGTGIPPRSRRPDPESAWAFADHPA